MNRFLFLLVLGGMASPVFAGDVAVSISAGQPGFYGRIDIGNFPQPALIYPESVLIERSPQFLAAAPIYLHVPPGHERHWRQHCAQYNACGRPVYFVRDDWYNERYVPQYAHGARHPQAGHDDHGEGRGHHEGKEHQDK